MKSMSNFKFLQAFFGTLLLTLTFLFVERTSNPVQSSPIRNGVLIESLINPLLHIIYTHPTFLLSCIWCLVLSILYYYTSSPNPVFLLDFSCFKPNPNQKCSYKASELFVLRTNRFSEESQEFMRKIYLRSGLGDETYAPKFVFQSNPKADLESAFDEAQEGMFSSINSVLSKTNIDPSRIDCLIVTCGSFSPMPSLTSLIVNHFKLKSDLKTYNFSGMGCSSGVMSIDLAANVLKQSNKIGYALVVIIETINLNWYYGDSRPMLVTNCIFRVGCVAAMITNDPSCRRVAKMELVHSLRTHHGANDRAYKAAFQEEDDKGCTGFSLTKDLIPVAGMFLREHIKILGPRVLPLSQLGMYVYSVIRSTMTRGASKPIVPDFTKAFDHFCIHTGGKAVIEQVGRVLRLGEELTEPARMSLHRFGNTSSSLVFYELAYLEAKGRVRKGDRVWMLGFGTGFKVGSLVWKALLDFGNERDNPWSDCIDRYPLKSW
ncbi:PREDICTED: 3-ketoacyl-CoA synthase [Prunus dulcis]|uniref:3-ketoacyl-CoA synthase n=2 Tax=Prunus dulcis TaxID=3755 RepID=A0A5E4GBN2_PRUDU|nr:3-ketoacyl-CoA synthase 1-like [Prunus dulcis]VVA37012.1 PREDICTED: 3-ketoacyl-CoA synthase [Prunus dulcis]